MTDCENSGSQLDQIELGWREHFLRSPDTNNGSSTDPNRASLNVTLIDNVVVTAVPEPSALGLCLIGATVTLVRRRRRR